MKRFLLLLLSAALLLSMCSVAFAADADTKLEVVRVLGIMVGDTHGNLNLDKAVTRAEFTKMMAAASSHKDSVTAGGGASLFTDVKSAHWAGNYIGVAVDEGWMVGYIDGSFRPERTITLEEGCTALLRMLGYDASALAGSYPAAQLSKAQAVGLRDDLAAEQGHVLTRQDCVTMFYNLLLCQNSGGQVYGSTLGYTVKNNEVDYAALISADTKGPYVAENGTPELPFGTENITVYRNGKEVTLSALMQNDVYYYHSNLRTVWTYNDRVGGTLTAVSPNRVSPSTVSVGGVSYTLGTTKAVYQVSAQGEFRQGDVVTLLLGMDGSVVKILSAEQSEQVYYGIVLSSQKQSSADGSSLQTVTTVVCTDGTERTFYHNGAMHTEGATVSVVVGANGTTVAALQKQRISGTVNAAGTSIGSYRFAANAEILDTDGSGGYVRIYPQRLAQSTLQESHVLHYALNDVGEIQSMILQRATGDMWQYGFVTEYADRSSVNNVSARYTYISGGKTSSVSVSAVFPVQKGGIMMQFKNGALDRMYQLGATRLDYITEQSASGGGRSFRIAENVQAVVCENTSTLSYYAVELSQLNAAEYKLTGWYDNDGAPAGGQLRVIVAEPK